jgi:hypothetical protein
MDFSKLGQNEKLAVYGAIASIVGPILASMGFGFGVGGLTLILALAMLPGSKGSLMLLVGGIAAVSAALALLGSIGYLGFFGSDLVFVIGWLLGIAGGLLMGWAGWQEFQAEGGKFQLGTSPAGDPAPRSDAPSQATTSAPPAAAPEAPEARATDTTVDTTMGDADDDRRSDL